MISRNTFFYLLFCFSFCICSQAQQATNLSIENLSFSVVSDSTAQISPITKIDIRDSILIPIDSVLTARLTDSIIYPPLQRDWRRLGYNTALYAGFTVIGFGILWTMPESTTNWDKQKMREKGIAWKWKRNVATTPVMDNDNWVLNWISHPYFGGVYYMTARTSGFTVLESFTYSTLMSTFFWEYGIEAFAEIPSIQDLIITPVVGSVMGEGFFYAKKSILKHDKKVLNSRFLGITTLVLIDPFNTILDGFGYKDKVKTQMNIAPVGVNQFSKAPIWGVQFSARF